MDKQIIYLNRRGYFFTTLKTKSSERYIVIDDFFAGELRHWKEAQIENEKSAGAFYVYVYRDNTDKVIQQSKSLDIATEYKCVKIVCTHSDGHAVLKCMLTNIFNRENINAHSFRHTHATILIESGATPKGVAGRLGHTSDNAKFIHS